MPVEPSDLKIIADQVGPAAVAIALAKSENVGKVLDAAKPLTEELANLGAAVVRTANNLLAVGEGYSARILNIFRYAIGLVPPTRRIDAPPTIVGPIIENVRFMEAENPLLDLYKRLLASAMDSERSHAAHCLRS